MEKILLFMPGYNCENQIVRVLDQLDSSVAKWFHEIILIDNRSTDNTVLKVLEHPLYTQLPIKVLRNDENYGLGGSHKAAFRYAKENGFDYVVVLHGDDQADVRDIEPMLVQGEHLNHDCILGARFMKTSRLQGYSRFRTFGNKVYNLIFSVLLGRRIYDLGSGLNIYSTTMLMDDFYIKFPDNLMFNYNMIMAAKYYKHDMIFFPISWREFDQVSNVKMMNQAVKVLRMLFGFFFNPKAITTNEYRNTPIEHYTSTEIKGSTSNEKK